LSALHVGLTLLPEIFIYYIALVSLYEHNWNLKKLRSLFRLNIYHNLRITKNKNKKTSEKGNESLPWRQSPPNLLQGHEGRNTNLVDLSISLSADNPSHTLNLNCTPQTSLQFHSCSLLTNDIDEQGNFNAGTKNFSYFRLCHHGS
jgi:hypothetical protein